MIIKHTNKNSKVVRVCIKNTSIFPYKTSQESKSVRKNTFLSLFVAIFEGTKNIPSHVHNKTLIGGQCPCSVFPAMKTTEQQHTHPEQSFFGKIFFILFFCYFFTLSCIRL